MESKTTIPEWEKEFWQMLDRTQRENGHVFICRGRDVLSCPCNIPYDILEFIRKYKHKWQATK